MQTADIKDIKTMWEDMESQNGISPFSTWVWNYDWLKYWKKTPYIYADDNGIAPFVIGRGGLRFIGYNNGDYLGFLIKEGREAEFFDSLSDKLAGDRISFLDLGNVTQQFSGCEISGFDKRVFNGDICPYVILPDDVDEYMSALNKRFRKNMEYYWRKINRDHNVVYDIVSRNEDIRPTMMKMIGLHQKRWHKRHLPGAFRSSRIINFHLDVSSDFFHRRYLDLHRLIIDGEIAAVLYCFHKGDSTYYYLGGFDDRYENMSIGNLITWMAIKTSIERGDTIFDFLRGNESYKQNFCTDEKMNRRLVFYKGNEGKIRTGMVEKQNRLVMAVKTHYEV